LTQLHRLEGFYWVARTGGYARAARAFPYPLTQPAVYQQVRKLEDDLGLKLFERVGKADVRLTAAGRHLFEFAAPFFEALPSVVRALKAGAPAGELRIAADALVLHHLLPEWLRRLHRRLPEVRVDVRELPAPDPELVRTGVVDLAVAYFHDELPATLQTRRVATLSPYLALPADHPLARQRRLTLRDLADDTFVAYNPGTIHHALQMKAFARAGVAPRRMLSASTAEAILGLVATGIGYSLVPSLAEGGFSRRGVVARPFVEGKLDLPVLAVWRKGGPPNGAIEAALATAP
jgi:DNA-binding transcriptional LysR family regulator